MPGIKETNSEKEEREFLKSKKTTDKSLIIDMPTNKPEDWATNMSHFKKDSTCFHVMGHLEPHDVRRKKILEAHPEVEKLFEKDPTSLYWTIALNLFQLGMLFFLKYYVETWRWTLFWTYMVSAVVNHALFCLMHDITHFTSFKSVFHNQLLAILTNLPQAIPNAISFGRYHRDHHTFLGDAVDDPDIPTLLEVRLFRNKYTKGIFLILMPIFYALRPYFKRPKIQNSMEVANIISCIIVDVLVYKYFGGKALVYLVMGTLWGLSLHPAGIHILAEHYEFNKNQDTYSYYGWFNLVNFNMGYHVEHHDFPNIPWNRLPDLKKMAPEFYDNLPQIDSYFHVMYSYVFDSDIGPWSRVVRIPEN